MVPEQECDLLVDALDGLLALAILVEDLKKGLVDALVVCERLFDPVDVRDGLIELDRRLLLRRPARQIFHLDLVPLGEEGVEPQDELLVAVEQVLHLFDDARGVDRLGLELLHNLQEVVIDLPVVLKPGLDLAEVREGVLENERGVARVRVQGTRRADVDVDVETETDTYICCEALSLRVVHFRSLCYLWRPRGLKEGQRVRESLGRRGPRRRDGGIRSPSLATNPIRRARVAGGSAKCPKHAGPRLGWTQLKPLRATGELKIRAVTLVPPHAVNAPRPRGLKS